MNWLKKQTAKRWHHQEQLLHVIQNYMSQELRAKIREEVPQAYDAWMDNWYSKMRCDICDIEITEGHVGRHWIPDLENFKEGALCQQCYEKDKKEDNQ